MCGITGVYHFDKSRSVDSNILKKMTDLIQHRGPDGKGYYTNMNIGLGHRRLSVIDLDTGDQPIFSDDMQKCLIFNGEIYNYVELRNELIDKGYVFRTTSDTEVVLKAYEEWGVDCQLKFNGMWAFIISDSKNQNLFISRDRMGIKPLYYKMSTSSVYFSSEIKSFNAVCKLKIDKYEAWDRLVFGPLFGEKTIYKDVYELLPGKYMLVNGNSVKTHTYFDLKSTFQEGKKKYNLKHIEHLIQDSIKLRLMSDVSIGTINSGGLDSSFISAIATGIYKDKLKTFSVAPQRINGEILSGDESFYAERVASLINSDHKTVRYDQNEFIKDIPTTAYYNDNIVFHSNSIPLSFMMKEIKQTYSTTVVLGGEGADEIFRGYSINKFANFYYKAPSIFKKNILKYFDRKIVNLKMVNKFFPDVSLYLKLSIARNSHIDFETANELLGIKGRPSLERIKQINSASELDSINQLIYYEQTNYLKGLLHRVDRMSMRASVEARVPFLDHRIVEYVNSISYKSKSSILESSVKKILKKIASKHVDKQIIKRKKYGFSSPIEAYKLELENDLGALSLDLKGLTSQELFVIDSYLKHL